MNVDSPSRFIVNLKSLMKQSGYTYTGLSLQTGLSVSSLTRYMNGTSPRTTALRLLASAFGVSPEELVHGENPVATKRAPQVTQGTLFGIEEREPDPATPASPYVKAATCSLVLQRRMKDFFLSQGQFGIEGQTAVPSDIDPETNLVGVIAEEDDDSIGIRKDDILFVRLASFFQDGDLVLANLGNEFKFGKVSIENGNPRLAIQGQTGIEFSWGTANKVVGMVRLF